MTILVSFRSLLGIETNHTFRTSRSPKKTDSKSERGKPHSHKDTTGSGEGTMICTPTRERLPQWTDSYSEVPRGRKYWVPLTGSWRRRRRSWRSSLRTTKSMSEVLMTRRSEAA